MGIVGSCCSDEAPLQVGVVEGRGTTWRGVSGPRLEEYSFDRCAVRGLWWGLLCMLTEV